MLEQIKNTLANTISLLGGSADIVNIIRSDENLSMEQTLSKLKEYNYDLTTQVKDRLANCNG